MLIKIIVNEGFLFILYLFHVMKSRNNNVEVRFFRGKNTEINTIRRGKTNLICQILLNNLGKYLTASFQTDMHQMVA